MNRPSVDAALTQATAQTQLTRYYTATLAKVPAGLSLSYAPPTETTEAQEPSFTVPCDDNDQTGTGPLNLQGAYWVHGISNGAQQSTLDAFSTAFTTQGWQVANDNHGVIRALTPDGYVLVANLNGVGNISLSGVSPCFPRTNQGDTAPSVTAIAHP